MYKSLAEKPSFEKKKTIGQKKDLKKKVWRETMKKTLKKQNLQKKKKPWKQILGKHPKKNWRNKP